MEALLRELGLYQYTQQSFAEIFEDGGAFGQSELARNLVHALTTINYNQDSARMSALATLIALAPTTGGSRVRDILGGNSQVPRSPPPAVR